MKVLTAQNKRSPAAWEVLKQVVSQQYPHCVNTIYSNP